MSNNKINEEYLQNFFGISADEEGLKEAGKILARLERLEFNNSQDIIVIDDEPDGMYFLESGMAAVLDRSGRQVNMMHEGQCFGEYAVLAQSRRMTTVRSVGRTVVFRLGGDELLEILHEHPKIYGEMMKKVYDQVTGKHSQILLLSKMRRGILQVPENQAPLTPKRMLLQYGGLALLFLLSALFIPKNGAVPLFAPPLLLMLVYVLLTKSTVESLLVSGMYAAVLLYRSGLAPGYTDSLIKTMSDGGNVFTVLVMALMGGVVTLIEASGAVTAFKKLSEQKIKTGRGARLAMIGIMAVTAIDDCLNMLCAATSIRTSADKQRVPREDQALLLSLLPTCLSSFIPFSLWGIFVVANINLVPGIDGFPMLCRAVPFNIFPILCTLAMVAFSCGAFPRSRRLINARKRVEEGGELWPEGSAPYLVREDTQLWGRLRNLLLPVAVLGIATVTVRSVWEGRLMVDSACGLVATLIFMFFLYCAQGIMSPEKFMEELINGIQSMTLPIILYLLTMCFSALLDQERIGSSLGNGLRALGLPDNIMPVVLFLVFSLLTMALGSSWAMYAIAFPLGMRIAISMGLNLPLCAGAICSAGIAGEKLCPFTSDSLSVGTSIGCDPNAVLHTRIPYSIVMFILSLLLYTLAGFVF